MSVKHAMLALLAAAPSSTYQLRKRFDASTGQGLPMNIGQVSSTLQRLERDGMVARDEETEASGDSRVAGTGGQLWRLLPAGQAELASWWASPVLGEQRGRDELVLKLSLAILTPGVDVAALLQSQRAATQRTMHDLTRARRSVGSGSPAAGNDTSGDPASTEAQRQDIVGRLVIDHHIFTAEAELRWLDDAEAALQRAAATATATAPSASAAGSALPAPADAIAEADAIAVASRAEGTR